MFNNYQMEGISCQNQPILNSTVKPIGDELLHTLFEKQAQENPQQIAVVGNGMRLRYSELIQMSRKLGLQLREMGVKPNTLVAIVMEKGWEQIVAALGILQSGAAYVPIDAGQPPERLFKLLKNAEVQIVLTQPSVNNVLAWPADIRDRKSVV